MTRVRLQEEMNRQLPPEVARFVGHALVRLDEENIFDAPGVISGVLRQMRVADCDTIRRAAAHAELLLKSAFVHGRLNQATSI